jgi:hypothetical protein
VSAASRLLIAKDMTASLDTWALTTEEEDFFRAGDELEAMQALDSLDQADERPSLWQRLFHKTER